MTGAAALAAGPMLVPSVGLFVPAAEGFTLGQVTRAVEALKAANVPTLDGYYWARHDATVVSPELAAEIARLRIVTTIGVPW
jgi:hypothetical protein